jgi:hypothetical protein
MSGDVSVNSGYGVVTVPDWQLQLWNQYGWPDEDVLRRMGHAQAKHGDANASCSCEGGD